MDHLYRSEECNFALCGRSIINRDERTAFLLLEYYKNGFWKRDVIPYTWCEECLEAIPDLEYINNTEL